MPVTVTDRSKEAADRYRDAARLGIAAAGNVLVREVKKGFGSDYYKGGRFRSTLQVRASVRRSDPERSADGWSLQVGTKLIEALYWELGHYNTFTRKHERVRIWEPVAIAQTTAMLTSFARIVAREMGKQ